MYKCVEYVEYIEKFINKWDLFQEDLGIYSFILY